MKVAKGIGVSSGKASGFARIITSYDDVRAFEKGEILITTITDPTMVPAMNKAAGIICSSGGLMSHPAITSREMGIPCVVQATVEKTPITEIVKTGDFIALCGKTGEIEIEKRLHWVSEFIQGANQVLAHMHPVVLQPIDYLQIYPLFAAHFIEKIELLIEKTKNISKKELANCWPTTAGIRIQLLLLLSLLKSTKTTKQTRLRLADFYFSMIQERSVGNVHGMGENKTRTDEEIIKHLDEINLDKADTDRAKLLGRIANATYNLAAGLYTDNYVDYAVENEGPYNVSSIFGEGHILVIRRYLGLQSHIWPETLCPVNNLQVYCIFKDVKFSCELGSCHSLYKGDVISGLQAFKVFADSKSLATKEQLKNLLKNLEEHCVSQWQRLTNLPLQEQKKKILEIKLYGMRKLFDKAELDWRPSKEMFQALKQPLKVVAFWGGSERNEQDYWEKIYDPHLDFYPPGITNEKN